MSKNKSIKNYQGYSPEELVKEIKNLLAKLKPKYGLVWEDRPEDVVKLCEEKYPVLKEVLANNVKGESSQPSHILIEGDNYHAISVLNYTHKGEIDVMYIDPPYNTGAKDWKYNNNYVDETDDYRHSNWLSMMHHRLRIAKKLLKKTGVLIVTIDDNELLSLLGLLEKLNANRLGIVSICIKPEGRRQSKYIMEAHEYAIFVTWGNPVMRGLDVDFGLHFPENDSEGEFRWEGLMRRDAPREDRGSDYWFSFYVSKDRKLSITKKPGYTEVLPINTKGVERVWLWDKERAGENLDKLTAEIRKERITIYYKRRKLGRVKPTSFWYGSKYNANAYGTRVLTSILPNSEFNFPKSVYSTLDCIDLFLPENGIVLDFFAGSGTTAHSVLELNKTDNGTRQFILCTNNENKIATDECLPRIKRVINGYKVGKNKIKGSGGNLKYFQIDFVDADISDQNKKQLVDKSTEMLCLKENCFDKVKSAKSFKIFKNNFNKYLGIVFDDSGISSIKNEIKKIGKPFVVYVFSLDESAREEEFEDIEDLVTLISIPSGILSVYRSIFK